MEITKSWQRDSGDLLEVLRIEVESLARCRGDSHELTRKIDTLLERMRRWKRDGLSSNHVAVDPSNEGEATMETRKVATLYVAGGEVLIDDNNKLALRLWDANGLDKAVLEAIESINRRLERSGYIVDAVGRKVPLDDPTGDEVLDGLTTIVCSRTDGAVIMYHQSRDFTPEDAKDH